MESEAEGMGDNDLNFAHFSFWFSLQNSVYDTIRLPTKYKQRFYKLCNENESIMHKSVGLNYHIHFLQRRCSGVNIGVGNKSDFI